MTVWIQTKVTSLTCQSKSHIIPVNQFPHEQMNRWNWKLHYDMTDCLKKWQSTPATDLKRRRHINWYLNERWSAAYLCPKGSPERSCSWPCTNHCLQTMPELCCPRTSDEAERRHKQIKPPPRDHHQNHYHHMITTTWLPPPHDHHMITTTWSPPRDHHQNHHHHHTITTTWSPPHDYHHMITTWSQPPRDHHQNHHHHVITTKTTTTTTWSPPKPPPPHDHHQSHYHRVIIIIIVNCDQQTTYNWLDKQ